MPDSRQVYTEVFEIIFAFHSVVSNSSVTAVRMTPNHLHSHLPSPASARFRREKSFSALHQDLFANPFQIKTVLSDPVDTRESAAPPFTAAMDLISPEWRLCASHVIYMGYFTCLDAAYMREATRTSTGSNPVVDAHNKAGNRKNTHGEKHVAANLSSFSSTLPVSTSHSLICLS